MALATAQFSAALTTLTMMMKMGFKPGQTLGLSEETAKEPPKTDNPVYNTQSPVVDQVSGHSHKAEPIPLNEWAGL